MKTNSRAFVIPAVVYVAAGLIAIGGWAYVKVFEPGRNKAVATAAATAAADAETKAKQAREQAEAVDKAVAAATADHQKVVAQRDQIDQNTSGFIEGAKIAIQADPAPSDADVVALGLLDSAGQALGQPLTPQQRAFWMKTVSDLIAKNAEAKAKVAQLTKEAAEARAALGEVQAHATASDAHAKVLCDQLATKSKELVESTAKSATLTAENKQWADGEQTLWGRIKALGILAIVLAVIGLAISIKLLGVQGTAKDAVALGEHLKSLALTGVKDASELEQKISAWWENDKSAQAAVNKIKSTLRL